MNQFKLALCMGISVFLFGCFDSVGTRKPSEDGLVAKKVHILDSASLSQIQNTDFSSDTAHTILRVKKGSNLEKYTQVDEIISIMPTSDSTYPLGFSGKVVSRLENQDSTVDFVTTTPKLAEIFDTVSLPDVSMELNASNLYGVITPPGLEFDLNGTPISGTTFFTNDQRVALARAIAADAGFKFSLKKSIKLSEIISKETMTNVKVDPELKYELDLSNLDAQMSGVFPSQESKNISLTGDFGAKLSISGDVDGIKFGYENKIWKEIEEAGIGKLKIKGLGKGDKVGKFPLMAFIFKPQLPTKFVAKYVPSRQSQNAQIRNNSGAGIIVWVYFVANGELKFSGNMDLVDLPKKSLTLQALDENGWSMNSSLKSKATEEYYMKLFSLKDAKVGATARSGISIEADFFVAGVRPVNIGLFGGGQLTANLEGGLFSLKKATETSDFAFEWSPDFKADANLGGGAIVSGNFDFGWKLDTKNEWLKCFIPDGSFAYKVQYPSEDDIKNNTTPDGLPKLWYNLANWKYPSSSSSSLSSFSSSDISSSSVQSSQSSSSSGSVSYGTLTDSRDGQNYKTVKIGSQVWMAQNLNYGTKVVGESNQSNDAMVEKYCYNDDDAKCATYGGLYQWAEAMAFPASCNSTDCASSVQSKHQGICPKGWHMPTDAEWKTLEMYLGLTQTEADAAGMRGVVGSKLKSKTNWDGSDEFGFSALPAGYRYYDGSFNDVGSAFFWSASQSDATAAWTRNLHGGSMGVGRGSNPKVIGFSVRCLQD